MTSRPNIYEADKDVAVQKPVKRSPKESPRKTQPPTERKSTRRTAESSPRRSVSKCSLANCGDPSCKSTAPHHYSCSECGLVFVLPSRLVKHVNSECNPKPRKFKKVLTVQERRDRRAKNAGERNAARKQEIVDLAKFVHRPQVFVRVRPLNEAEQKDSYVMPGLKTETELAKDLKNQEKVTMIDGCVLTGFEGVLGTKSSNAEVYGAMLADKIEMILRGGQVSMFCYGHTGTGKTHTSMGYASEPGLFKLACEDILKALNKVNVSLPDEEKLLIQVRFTEVHLGKVYDLLENPKAECYTREDDDGTFRIRRQPVKNEKGWVITGDQQFVVVEDLPTLLKMLEKGIETRACGSSSVHDQSSRSHAMMEMEIVNGALKEERHALIELEAELCYGKNQCDLKDPEWPRSRLGKIKEKVSKTRRSMNDILEKSRSHGLGGTLTLADLAGADWDHRTFSESGESGDGKGRQEQRESAEINKELSVLKECMRTDKNFKPWRESVLTKILKKVLQPPSGRETQSILVSTVTPVETEERHTLNTLRYGQYVSGYEDNKTFSANVLRDRDMKRQIRAVYREYSDKSPEEVEAIISKWQTKGKLYRLLANCWRKYTSTEAKAAAAAKFAVPASTQAVAA